MIIDNRDVIATVKRYDSAKTLFYIDPPYCGVEHYYEASKGGFDHEGLAGVLNQICGFAALSYYPHPLIDRLYPRDKWQRITWEQPISSNIQSESQRMVTEMLLINYDSPISHRTLWDTVTA